MSTVEITSRTGLVNAWSAIRVGLGSLLDLRGQATYEAMQDLLPSPKLRPMSAIYADTNRVMSETPTSLKSLRTSSRK